MNYIIYLATNKINNKKYVGFATNLEDRKTVHYCEAFTRQSLFTFHKALRKYGKESFQWDILEKGSDHYHMLKNREPFYIKQHNSHFLNGHGYNMTLGGDGIVGYRFSEMQKKKLSESHTGYTMPQKQKDAIRKAHIGKKKSKTHCENIKKAVSKQWTVIDPNGKSTTITDLKTFCKLNQLRYPAMHRVASGGMNQHRGYKCSKFNEDTQ